MSFYTYHTETELKSQAISDNWNRNIDVFETEDECMQAVAT